MYADSSAFVAWATQCVVERGLQQIDNPSLGYASYGEDKNGIGKADNQPVSLGDGGDAVLTFDSPICNGQGPDFAVFENAFHAEPHVFLELAFVEVSSDGVNYFRFPAVTRVPFDAQLDGFAVMDASKIHNFAGKYEAWYGTPFDLDELDDNLNLDKNRVTHVRLVDVVGNLQPEYATYDSEGNPVNDPWPTPFWSSGFDLDAVGVIHDLAHHAGVSEDEAFMTAVFPNPVCGSLSLVVSEPAHVEVHDVMGRLMCAFQMEGEAKIDVSSYQSGVYFVKMVSKNINCIKKIVKQ